MNVLLVYPEFPDTFWSLKHALRFVRKKAFSPPLGLLTVAAMLPGEWGKRLVDVNVTPLCQRDLAWADYAFVNGMAVQGQSARVSEVLGADPWQACSADAQSNTEGTASGLNWGAACRA